MANGIPDHQSFRDHFRGGVTTSGAETKIVVSLNLSDESVYLVEVNVVAHVIGGTDTAAYFRRLHVERQTGTSKLVATLDTSESEDDAALACVASVNDTTDKLEVKVTGLVGKTVHWGGWIDAVCQC